MLGLGRVTNSDPVSVLVGTALRGLGAGADTWSVRLRVRVKTAHISIMTSIHPMNVLKVLL